jgi:hypothetical protein
MLHFRIIVLLSVLKYSENRYCTVTVTDFAMKVKEMPISWFKLYVILQKMPDCYNIVWVICDKYKIGGANRGSNKKRQSL